MSATTGTCILNNSEHGSVTKTVTTTTHTSLVPENSSIPAGSGSGSVSPISSSSASSSTFPGNVTALLQQFQQSNTASQAPTLMNVLAENNANVEQALANELKRSELIKSQLSVLDKMAMAQATADRQKAALLASSGMIMPAALQQAAAINALLLSSSLAAQSLTPLQVGSLAAAQSLPMAAANLSQAVTTQVNPSHNNNNSNGVFGNQLASNSTTQSIHRVPYRDASLTPDPSSKSKTEHFPTKIHRMLEDMERQSLSDVASFLPHGRAFIIYNPTRFANEVMPRYFRMSRFSSFQRQLNLYDFKRVTEGKDKGAYYHELFLYGRRALTTRMRRTKIKTNVPFVPHQTVDFYQMPPIPRTQQEDVNITNTSIAISG